MAMWNWETPDMADNAAVSQRVADYFTLCDQDSIKPSVAGMALAFGIERTVFTRMVNGERGKLSSDVKHTLKKAYQILNAQMETYMQDGKVNCVAGIFLMKNNMGYQDKTEMVLTPNQNVNDISPEQLQHKYLTDSSDDLD